MPAQQALSLPAAPQAGRKIACSLVIPSSYPGWMTALDSQQYCARSGSTHNAGQLVRSLLPLMLFLSPLPSSESSERSSRTACRQQSYTSEEQTRHSRPRASHIVIERAKVLEGKHKLGGCLLIFHSFFLFVCLFCFVLLCFALWWCISTRDTAMPVTHRIPRLPRNTYILRRIVKSRAEF